MSMTIIVAIDAGRGSGVDNRLPWPLPEDLSPFQQHLTAGRPITTGRKTFGAHQTPAAQPTQHRGRP